MAITAAEILQRIKDEEQARAEGRYVPPASSRSTLDTQPYVPTPREDLNVVALNQAKAAATERIQKDQALGKAGKSMLIPDSIEGFGATLGTAFGTNAAQRDINAAAVTDQDERLKLARLMNAPGTSPEQKARIRAQLMGSQGNIGVATEQIGELNKTAADVFSEGAGVAGLVMAGGGAGGIAKGTFGLGKQAASTAAGRIGYGATEGVLGGLKAGLEEDDPTVMGTISRAALGGAVGGATTGVLEGMFALGGKAINKMTLENSMAGRNMNYQLRPDEQQLTAEIKKGMATFGKRVADEVDEAGVPVYMGKMNTMLGQAKDQISENGRELDGILEKYSKKTLTRDQLRKRVELDITNFFGPVKQSELKTIKEELGRNVNMLKFNPKDALMLKRSTDERIPDNFWLQMVSGDRPTKLAVYTRYAIRNNLRSMINESAEGADAAAIKELNRRMGLGMEVRLLAASRLAAGQVGAPAVQGQAARNPKSWWGALLDSTVFLPSITTHATRGTKSPVVRGALNYAENAAVPVANAVAQDFATEEEDSPPVP